MDEKRSSGFQPLALTLTVAAAFLRLAPHPPNFAPVGSVALFGGARLWGWQAFAVPLLAMLVTDPILSHMVGFPAYSWGTLVIYCCFLINVLFGRAFLRHTSSPARIGTVAIAGSVQFFMITNFFSWAPAGSIYPHTWAGLAACYIAALPFFGYTVLGDLFYSAVLFGAYALLKRKAISVQRSAVS